VGGPKGELARAMVHSVTSHWITDQLPEQPHSSTHRAKADKGNGEDGQGHIAERDLQPTAHILERHRPAIVCKANNNTG
jgi:hypothetical protein